LETLPAQLAKPPITQHFFNVLGNGFAAIRAERLSLSGNVIYFREAAPLSPASRARPLTTNY